MIAVLVGNLCGRSEGGREEGIVTQFKKAQSGNITNP